MAIPFKKLGYKLNPITQDIETPQVFLVNKKLKKIGELYPVENFNITINEVNQPDEVSFTYYKEVDGVACPYFDKLVDLSVIQVGNYGFFEIGIGKSENTSIVKNITGQSLGMAELSQINATLDVNTDEDFETNKDTETNKYSPTVFYREIKPEDNETDKKKKKETSLLDRILSYAPHYSVGYVAPTLKNIQRTFSWSDSDIVSVLNDVAEEINCVFDIRVTVNENGEAERTVNAYDMQYCKHCWESLDKNEQMTNDTHTFRNIVNGVCQNCGSSKFIKDIGQDTTIFLSTNNLSDEITIDGDKDSIKNCFKVVGGDDTITATVQGLNMSANNRIMMFSDEQKKLMSPELVEKLKAYDKDYAENSGDYERLLEIQYDLYDMILYLQSGKMPLLEEEITKTPEALYHVIDQITTYYKNRFYISTWNNYGYSAARTSINNMFTTFMPKGFSFSVDMDGMEQTENYDPAKQYKWYGSIKIYSTGNRDDYYTIKISQTGETSVTHGKSETSFQFSEAEKQRKISNFSIIFHFADKNQDDYMNYIKQYTSYLLSEVELTYDNEKARNWDQYSYNRLESYYDGFNTCIEEIDGMPNERVTTEGENDILTAIKNNYMAIQSHIHAQMQDLRDQIFALSTYLGEFSNDFLDENGNPHHEFKNYRNVADAFSRMINPNYTGGYGVKSDGTTDTSIFLPNEFIGTKPCKCKKCSSTNVSVIEEGVNKCNNCGSNDIYSYYDVMKDIVDSYVENREKKPNTSIVDMRKEIQAQFDVKTYFNDDNLYNELFSFIREDVYTNDNYRSDGLTNSQLVGHARELMAKARQELSKACMTQYTVTAPVSAIVGQTAFAYKGIMVNDDYSGFMLNNYVRVQIDEDIYKMRIASIQFSFPIQDKINVTFTNVSHYNNGAMSDVASIVENAASMATSYNYVATQAEKGESASQQFDTIKNEGLDAGLMAIKGGRDQDVVIDNHGILLRRKIHEIDDYSDYQMKLINRNIVLTNDNWKHARMAIGLGTYNEEPVYGVWADVLVGDLTVTKELHVKNDKETVIIDENGITMTNGSIYIKNEDGCSVMIDPMYSLEENKERNIFVIKNKGGNVTMSVDSGGNGKFSGEISAKEGEIGGWYIKDTYLFNNTESLVSNKAGMYLGIDGIRSCLDANSNVNISSGQIFVKENGFGGIIIDDKTYKCTLHGSYMDFSRNGSKGYKAIVGKTETTDCCFALTNQDNVITAYLTHNSFLLSGPMTCERLEITSDSDNVLVSYGSVYFDKMLEVNNGVLCSLKHGIQEHDFNSHWTDSRNLSTGALYNLASVSYVQDNFARQSSDKRVKQNFSKLPDNIDDIFDSFHVNEFEYKDGLGIEGRFFGETAQHIEEILLNNNLDCDNYAIVGKRPIDSDNGESQYIDNNDKFHYIDHNNVIWLCVDQIQKLKRQVMELKRGDE